MIRKKTWDKITIIILAIGWAQSCLAADVPSGRSPKATPEFVEEGGAVYFRRCSFCHGLLGDGEGPAAKYLDPRPRDFTLGTFKFRTTQSGELPTNNDLFRTVSRGLTGTAMQAFDDDLIKNGLTERQRWAVIAYIKTFAQEFSDPELDPVKTGKVISLPANRPAMNADTIARGKKAFEQAKCWSCHGITGRGDGNKEFRQDDWGFTIRIRNVTHPWKIKAGGSVEQIYMRLTSGISGSPMPSFIKSLNEEERWYVASYIKSLQHKLSTHQVLKALRIDGALPSAPDAKIWAGAEPMDVRLAGQVVSAPRWQNPSIEMVTLRAVFNDKEIAFKLTWDDPFKDVKHDASQEIDVKNLSRLGAFSSYVEPNGMVQQKLGNFRDSVALQFPVKLPDGTKKPHFYRGSSSNPVHLWRWMSERDATGKRSAEEYIARGWKQSLKQQAVNEQQINAESKWDQGRWSVVMKRPLDTGDKKDVQFKTGIFIPMAVNAWDGSNGEHGLIMSLSTWYFVFLEESTPNSVYLYTTLAFLIVGGFGIWLTKAAKSEMRENENA